MRRIGFTRNTDGITPESYLACLVLHPANLKELFLENGHRVFLLKKHASILSKNSIEMDAFATRFWGSSKL